MPQINASLGAKSGGLENIAPLVAKQAEMLEALGCVCMECHSLYGMAKRRPQCARRSAGRNARAQPRGTESERSMRRPHASGWLHRVEVYRSPAEPHSAAWCLVLHALLA